MALRLKRIQNMTEQSLLGVNYNTIKIFKILVYIAIQIKSLVVSKYKLPTASTKPTGPGPWAAGGAGPKNQEIVVLNLENAKLHDQKIKHLEEHVLCYNNGSTVILYSDFTKCPSHFSKQGKPSQPTGRSPAHVAL